MENDQKIEEILGIVLQERELNNTRFSQLSSTLIDLSKEVKGVKVDIQALASDLVKQTKESIDFKKSWRDKEIKSHNSLTFLENH